MTEVVMLSGKSRHRTRVSRYSCPVEGCEVMVYVTHDPETGEGKVTDFACDRQGKCANPLFDPCPLYLDLVEKRGVPRNT